MGHTPLLFLMRQAIGQAPHLLLTPYLQLLQPLSTIRHFGMELFLGRLPTIPEHELIPIHILYLHHDPIHHYYREVFLVHE